MTHLNSIGLSRITEIFIIGHPYYSTLATRPTSYWRGHQTSPTVLSLKGRLPQKLQSKTTLSCEIVQILSLFRHGFIKNRNKNLTEIFNIRILFLGDGFRKTDLCIGFIANTYRGSIQNKRLFSVFSFIFCSVIILSKNGRGLILAYPQRIV